MQQISLDQSAQHYGLTAGSVSTVPAILYMYINWNSNQLGFQLNKSLQDFFSLSVFCSDCIWHDLPLRLQGLQLLLEDLNVSSISTAFCQRHAN